MRKIREILRLNHEAGLRHAKIGRALGLSKGVVTKYLGLCRVMGVAWPLPALVSRPADKNERTINAASSSLILPASTAA